MVETVVLLTLVVVDETVVLLTVIGVVVLVLVAVVVVVEQWRLTLHRISSSPKKKNRLENDTMDRSQEFRRVIEMLGAPGRPAAQRPQPRGTCIITDSILSHIFCWHLAENNFFLG